MFIDARKLPLNYAIDADICIIGAGAAGITIARELAGGRQQIALLESGDFEFDINTQKLYAGEVIGVAYRPLDISRLRFLGGSTNHWDGSCRPFDALDLADWPFGLEVLEPYYRRAHDVCQLGPYSYDPEDWKTPEAQPLQMPADATLRNGLFQYSPPTRFGTAYRQDLAAASNVTVYLNANLLQIEVNADASNVTGLQLACLDGKRFRARAKQYVLAAGGIENARLLLNCNRVQPNGLGNGNDLVGRYFMDHATVPGGATIVAKSASAEMRFYDHHVVRGHIIEGYFCAADEVRRREALPPFAIGILPAAVGDMPGVGNMALPAVIRRFMSDSTANAVAYDAAQWIDRLQAPVSWLYHRTWGGPAGKYMTYYTCGPQPDPQSRVTLSDTVNALGQRESRLDWRPPADFERIMQRAHELLGQELGRAGVGRLRIESTATTGSNPMENLQIGNHHMGTTRMHDDPRQGVVDAQSKVHGIDNLFIAGSSVFPSYACDDPTLTIVALALRLSDRLKSPRG
jgi:choline dehydrogenase-like flavoprotein